MKVATITDTRGAIAGNQKSPLFLLPCKATYTVCFHSPSDHSDPIPISLGFGHSLTRLCLLKKAYILSNEHVNAGRME